MHLIYLDESGQSGNNLNDLSQPIFVLAALVVPEARWLPVEKELLAAVAAFFLRRAPTASRFTPLPCAMGKATSANSPSRTVSISVTSACKSRKSTASSSLIAPSPRNGFKTGCRPPLAPGCSSIPRFAFPLVARVVDEYLKSLPSAPLGIFISDENREITGDVEKAIRLLRGTEGTLKLGQIIEKGFFIDSATSLLTQLCDVCAYCARKREEVQAGAALKPIDKRGVELIEPLIHRGNEAFQDTMDWMIALQKERSGQGSNPGR